jgi:hypothetical protein
MELLRSERNQLLLDDSSSNETKKEPVAIKIQSLTIDQINLLFSVFFSWVEEQSKDLSLSGTFTYETESDKSERKVESKRILFDSLSPPTKNLVLALGDVQLRKTLLFEKSYSTLFEKLSAIGVEVLQCLEASRKLYTSIVDSVEEQCEAIENKVYVELRNAKEFQDFVNEIAYLEKEVGIKYTHNEEDQEGQLLSRCTLVLVEVEKLSLGHIRIEAPRQGQDVSARIALRVKKNNLAKQKLSELLKNQHSSNLGVMLERLRVAENEIDNSIKSLANSMLPQTVNAQNFEYITTANEKVELLRARANAAQTFFKSARIKIKLTKSAVREEHCDELKNAKIVLADMILKQCELSRQQVSQTCSDVKQSHMLELESIKNLESTLKYELQNLLKLVRTDARVVDQCVRSLEDISVSRLEKIERENFSKQVTSLQKVSQVLTRRNK